MQLNEKELKKYNVIKDVTQGVKTKEEAMNILDISKRQIDRLINIYKTEGKNGFIHKNRGKSNENKIKEEIKQEIVNLFLTEYYDYNFTHFHEEIEEKYGISLPTVYRILSEEDIISPMAQHETVKLYNTNMRKAIKSGEASKEKMELFKKREKLEEEKHIRKSTLLYHFGQDVQMDAAFLIWFGEVATALHLTVDKATKKVLYGWFDYQETTNAYFILLMNIILKYGIPTNIKTDKRNTFIYRNNTLTQFGRICKDLEIKLSNSSDPLFKPNVERENKTFKGRLKAELRQKRITTIEEANRYLNEIFIPKINKKFSFDIDNNKNDMRENPYTAEELNIIISERYERMIDNASSIKYKGKYYIPIDNETGEVISYSHRTLCTFIIAYDKSYWCIVNNELYKLIEIKKLEPVKKEKEIKEPAYKGHKPTKDHPYSFENQQKAKEKLKELKELRKQYMK